MSALPDDVAALLTAIRDALDVPLPAATRTDADAHNLLIRHRADTVRIAVDSALRGSVGIGDAAWLREQLTAQPVTYTPWVPRHERGDGS